MTEYNENKTSKIDIISSLHKKNLNENEKKVRNFIKFYQ